MSYRKEAAKKAWNTRKPGASSRKGVLGRIIEEQKHHDITDADIQEVKRELVAQKAVETIRHHKNQAMAAQFKLPAIREWKYPSKSTPGKVYTTRKNQDGTYSCNCPAWAKHVDEHGHRNCTHCDQARKDDIS